MERLKRVESRFLEFTVLEPHRDSMANFFLYCAMTTEIRALKDGIDFFDRILAGHTAHIIT